MQILGGFFLLAGVITLAGSIIYGFQTRFWLEASYLGGIGVAALAFGLVLITLSDLLETSKKILTTLLSAPDTRPTECPKCGVFLTGERRFGKCFNCGEALAKAAADQANVRAR